jgi:hypothetical protein
MWLPIFNPLVNITTPLKPILGVAQARMPQIAPMNRRVKDHQLEMVLGFLHVDETSTSEM